ncbi:SDR family oxidoreductase [Streptomyces sp. NPDC059009]|uniref:SDR family oxidoreductase n=1 Tax=Streptomyces sp. NPDC059009 TaxID=3346694 RepID=UPI0036A35EEE
MLNQRIPTPRGPAAPVSPILITGCSTGIGRATAHRLVHDGHFVYATARTPEAVKELRGATCRTLRLDLTDEASMRAAVEVVEQEHGRIGTLVNNAGYAEIGPAELLTTERLRLQFETNVFGTWRLCQLALPAMRAAGTGRIVNVGSIGDSCTLPLWGAYTASKHALKALNDTLRMELAPYGITTVLVEPGLIDTHFAAAIDQNITRHGTDGPHPAYDAQMRGFGAVLGDVLSRGATSARLRATLLQRITQKPDAVARTIATAATAPRPHPHYRVPLHARLAIAAHHALPARSWDALTRLLFLGRAGAAAPPRGAPLAGAPARRVPGGER